MKEHKCEDCGSEVILLSIQYWNEQDALNIYLQCVKCDKVQFKMLEFRETIYKVLDDRSKKA